MRTKGTCLVCFGGEGDIHSSFATCPFPFLGGSNTAGHGYVLQKPAFITARKRSLRRLCFYRCLSVHNRGGACVVALGGCAWFCPGGGMHGFVWGGVWFCLGGMCGCSGGMCGFCPTGACMVLSGGHAWLLRGLHGFVWGSMVLSRGACMVLSGGACVVFPGGVHGFFRGACMVFFWGVCMVFSGGACMVFSGGRGGVHRIRRDTVNERAVRILLEWNAFLLLECLPFVNACFWSVFLRACAAIFCWSPLHFHRPCP